MKNKKNRETITSLIFVGIIILVIFLVFLIQNREKEPGGSELPVNDNPIEEFSDHFPECSLISDSCLNTNCDKYFLCNDKKYVTCEIYDCKKEFGIVTVDEDGEIKTKRRIKDNIERITEIKNRCDGKLEIIKSECVEEKLEMQVRVKTAGDCAIGGFMAVYKTGEIAGEKNVKSIEFSNSEEEFYLVKADNCEEISELIAVGEAGVSIR